MRPTRLSITVFIAILLLPLSVARSFADDTSCTQKQLSARLAPAAVDDVVFVSPGGGEVPIAVLANDFVAAGGTLSVTALGPCTCQDPNAPPAPPPPSCPVITTCGHGSARVAGGIVYYTPPSPPVPDSFNYNITDSAMPGSSSTGNVQVQVVGDAPLTVSCQSNFCSFTATPPNVASVRSYHWEWGDGVTKDEQGSPSDNHSYPTATANYTAKLTISYFDGSSVTSSTPVHVTFADKTTFVADCSLGLGCVMRVTLDPAYGFNGQAYVNWSENSADCDYGCGPKSRWPNNLPPYSWVTNSCVTSCNIAGGYFHAGTYHATVRAGSGATFTDYALAITVTNSAPRPAFTFTRTDPNVRAFSFDASQFNSLTYDDGPYPLSPFEWDFGDGTTFVDTAVPPSANVAQHTYASPGTYNVTLKVTDADGLSGVITNPVQVVNANPVPKITVHCAQLDCTFGSEPSFDDGNNITGWQWSFGDGTTATGPTVTKHFAGPGCYDVALIATDGDGGISDPTHQLVPAGPPVVAQSGGITVDAHVQSFQTAGVWQTTNGNLNGIAEPGETIVLEPTWPATAGTTAYTGRVSMASDPPGTSQRNSDFNFVANSATYTVTDGKSDCWSAGNCYAVKIADNINTRHDGRHDDYLVQETDATTGQPTAGSPLLIHMGKTFTDALPGFWAYSYIESVLHAGVDTGCGGGQFCPGTPLSRADIAVWVLKREHGGGYQPPACTTPPFNDVPCSLPQAAWIAQLAAEGLASGTGGGNYSPAASITRADAAILLLRSKMGASWIPPHCSPDYGDVQCPGNPAADWISAARTAGMSNGCTPTEFCPSDPVDRAQAASLFAKGFTLRIDGKQCAPDAPYDVVSTHTNYPAIRSLTFVPSPVVTGSTSTGTIVLGAPPAVALSVPLTIDVPAATIPSSVVVNAYQTTGTFTVTPTNVDVRTTTNISASYRDVTLTTRLDLCTPPPAISGQPLSRAINVGQSTTLQVTAAGGGTLTYQWYQGTAPSTAIPLGTASSQMVTPGATTSYWVNVTNACGSTASATATITVCTPPSITRQPASQIIAYGATATLTVTTAGSGPFTYQWYDGAVPSTTTPVGSNSATFITPALSANKTYWVRVTSTCNGTVTVDSTAATLTVVSQITRVQKVEAAVQSQTSIIGTWPNPTHVNNLLVAVFTAANNSAIGTLTPPTGWLLARDYEWNNIKTAIYYYPNNPGSRTTETFNAASYRDLTLQLTEYTWMSITSPLDQTAFDGWNTPTGGVVDTGNTSTTAQANELLLSALSTYAASSFTAPNNSFVKIQESTVSSDLTAAVHERIASAAGSYGHNATVGGNTQWLGMIATFKGASGPVTTPAISALTFSPSPASTGGTSTGTITLAAAPSSAAAIPLTVDAPSALTVPATVTVAAGATTGTFTVTPGSVSGRTTTNVTASYLGFTKTTQLDICPPAPSITTQPTSRTINSGQSTTLSVAATGTPLTYQWYQGTAPSTTTPVGTNSASLTVTPASTTGYWVSVSNGCGSTASTTATVTVCLPPSIVTQPSSPTIASGATATLTVAASGSGPLSYQWYQGTAGTTTTPVGTNSSSFTTPALTANRSYWVRVTSTCNGTAIADSVTATVTIATQITRVQSTAAAAQSQTSVTATWPSATHAGDLLVASVSAANNSYPIATFTMPAGWQLASTYEWNNIKTSLYYYPSNPGSRTVETVSVGTYRDLVLQLAEYSGVMSVSPLDKSNFNGANTPASGQVSTGSTATTAQSKELLISAMSIYAAISFTSPTNLFTKIQEQTVGSDLTAALFERIVSATGAYGHEATVSANVQWLGLIVTFKSADTSAALIRPPSVLYAGGASAPPRSGRSALASRASRDK